MFNSRCSQHERISCKCVVNETIYYIIHTHKRKAHTYMMMMSQVVICKIPNYTTTKTKQLLKQFSWVNVYVRLFKILPFMKKKRDPDTGTNYPTIN